jgi:hypothetical protein
MAPRKKKDEEPKKVDPVQKIKDAVVMPERRRVGRPSTYTEDMADALVDLMIEGQDIVMACENLGLNRGSVYRWMDQHPDFESRCARAREGMTEKRIHDLRQRIKDARVSGEDPAFLRVEVSFEQWNAERIAPKLYGNRVKTEVTGKDGAPMQLQTQVQVIDSRMLDPEQRDALRQILLAAANEGEQTDE